MKRPNVFIAIDVGSGSIKVIAGAINNKNVSVFKTARVRTKADGFKKGKIIDMYKVSTSIANAIAKMEQELNIKIKNVSLSVPPRQMQTFNSTGVSKVNTQDKKITYDVFSNVINSAKAQIDQIENQIIWVEPESAYINDKEVNPNSIIGKLAQELSISTTIYTLPKSEYQKYKQTLKYAGLNLTSLTISPLAIANEVVLSPNGLSIVVDMGHHNTILSAFFKNTLFATHIIEYGGKNITHEINTILDLRSYGQASTLKHKHSKLVMDDSTIIHIDNSGKEWLMSDVNKICLRNVIKIFKDVNAFATEVKNNIQEVDFVITGGTSQLKNILQVANKMLEGDTRIYVPNIIGASSPDFSAAIGTLYLQDKAFKQKQLAGKIGDTQDISSWYKKTKKSIFQIPIIKKILKKKG